jgi:two-component system CheB/CheR fusion protein
MRHDGKTHYLMRILPYRTLDQAMDGVLVTFTDITRTTEFEEYQDELGRRVEGVMRTVLDVARDSLAEDTAPPTLINRLKAVADTYALVSRGNWGDVALHDLAAKELGNYGIGRDARIVLDGPAVRLKAKAAVGIGMALHELAANAAKHGALSVPQGRVRLGWEIAEADGSGARLVIRWRESGGPPGGKDQASGYGGHLIGTGLQETIGARGSITVEDGGVAVSLVLPLSTGLVLRPDPAERQEPR